MTVRRYHPHALQKRLRSLPSLDLPASGSLPAETLVRARSLWEGDIHGWPPPESPHLHAPDGGVAEFGLDAVRLACLTAPEGSTPDLSLLASAWRWLAGFFEAFVGWRTDLTGQAWDPRPWIRAGATARDHLLKRGKVYPGLAAIRKAWKEAPVVPTTPPAGKRLSLLLLTPFAPVLARALSNPEILTGIAASLPASPAPNPDQADLLLPGVDLAQLLSAFSPLEPVCISLSKGGRRWEALDRQAISAHPREELADLPFLAATLRDCRWEARPVPEGWVIDLQGAKPAAGKAA